MAVVKKKRGRPKKESNSIESEVKAEPETKVSEPETKVVETIREVYVVEKAPEEVKEVEDPVELRYKELGIPKNIRDEIEEMARSRGAIISYDDEKGFLSIRRAHITETISLGGVPSSYVIGFVKNFIHKRKF